jgi:hypothetical protein
LPDSVYGYKDKNGASSWVCKKDSKDTAERIRNSKKPAKRIQQIKYTNKKEVDNFNRVSI